MDSEIVVEILAQTELQGAILALAAPLSSGLTGLWTVDC